MNIILNITKIRLKSFVGHQKMAYSTKVPSCPVCYEPYRSVPAASAEAKHLPKSLPCGHTICQGCAEKLQKKGAIVCPKDKKKFQVANVSDLPSNFGMLEMLEVMKTDESQQDNPGKRQRVNEDEPLCKDHNQVCVCVCVCVCFYIP